jgi:AcrR family transcriptional regulator
MVSIPNPPASDVVYPRYQRGDLRRAFLEGARLMLRERGEERFSLNELARQIGVSPGSAYRHFANKDALLAAVLAEAYRQLLADLVQPSPALAGAGERLLLLGVRYVEFAVANNDVFFMMFANRPVASETGGAETFAPLLEAVAQAREAHLLPAADVGEMAGAIWTTLHGIAVLHLSGGLSALGLDAAPEVLVRRTLQLHFPLLSPQSAV